ncbi:hypothetical protein [Corynebacterium matruchotii]|uniref:hypothetical protein n=1 Tax=Corynebacterium matruchotii TaxID=43768 RepID=UPI00366D90F6
MVSPHSASDNDNENDPSVSLVEIEPGLAVVMGDRPLESLGLPAEFDCEVIPFQLMPPEDIQNLADKISLTIGGLNLVAQIAQGVVSARGLVRLAPETRKALKSGQQPRTSGGKNLGVLAGKDGKITHQIRWMPATTGAKTTSVFAALGPAAAALMLQAQLASVSKKLDKNLEETQAVAHEIYKDRWYDLMGLYKNAMRAFREAQELGVVNQHTFSLVAADLSNLEGKRGSFRDNLRQHVDALKTDRKQQLGYIRENSNQILADVQAVLVAEETWRCFHLLRTTHISCDTTMDPALKEKQLAHMVEEVKREYTQSMDEVSHITFELERMCGLIAKLPGKRSMPFWGNTRNSDKVARMAATLAKTVSEMRNRVPAISKKPDPKVTVFHKDAPDEALALLQYLLPEDEPLLALALIKEKSYPWLPAGDVYLGITQTRFFISSKDKLCREGIIDRMYSLSSVRDVRLKEGLDPKLEILTGNNNISLYFTSSPMLMAKSGVAQLVSVATCVGAPDTINSWLADARRIRDLFATVMNIPEEEHHDDPLCAEAHQSFEVVQKTGMKEIPRKSLGISLDATKFRERIIERRVNGKDLQSLVKITTSEDGKMVVNVSAVIEGERATDVFEMIKFRFTGSGFTGFYAELVSKATGEVFVVSPDFTKPQVIIPFTLAILAVEGFTQAIKGSLFSCWKYSFTLWNNMPSLSFFLTSRN